MRIIRTCMSAALLALAVGCTSTADGMKEDTVRNTESTAKAAEASSDAIGGALETASIKSAIIADSRVSASEINVDTDDARKLVTLTGTVTTAVQKRIAGEIATSKATGYKIVNNLTIRQ